jgi:hypothetical protein
MELLSLQALNLCQSANKVGLSSKELVHLTVLGRVWELNDCPSNSSTVQAK